MPRRSGSAHRLAGSKLARFGRETNGNAAVEFAMVAPVLVFLVFGSLVFGLYFGLAHSLEQLASGAARASVAGMTSQERDSIARAYITNSVANYGLLRPADLTVRTADSTADPNVFTVGLSYNASSLGLNAFAGLIPMPLDRLDRSAAIRRGGA